jgi:hypothetical protein
MKLGLLRIRFREENINSSGLNGSGRFILYNFHMKIVFTGESEESLKKSLMRHLADGKSPDAYYFSVTFHLH